MSVRLNAEIVLLNKTRARSIVTRVISSYDQRLCVERKRTEITFTEAIPPLIRYFI